MTNRVTLAVLGACLLVADAGHAWAQTTTNYTYDALGRLATSKSSASTLRTTYSYDAAGNRSQVTVAVPGSGGTVAPPTCANNSGTITANQSSTVSTTLSVLSQCTDSAGNALTLSSWSVTGKGSGVLDPKYVGVLDLTLSVGTTYVNFTVSDGQGNTASGTFTFNRTS